MPYKRKSPIRHRVSAHIREGHHIVSYMRGHGSRNPCLRRTVLDDDDHYCEVKGKAVGVHCGKCDHSESFDSPEHEQRLYTVSFKYEDGRSETIKTVARSPRQALRFADRRRERDDRPTEVVVKNRIGAIIGRIAAGVVKVAKRVAKTYREAREKYREIMERDPKLDSLITRSYSDSPTERLRARAQLRKEYPQIYEELQFYTPPTRPEPREYPGIRKEAEVWGPKEQLEERIQLAKARGKSNPGHNPRKELEQLQRQLYHKDPKIREEALRILKRDYPHLPLSRVVAYPGRKPTFKPVFVVKKKDYWLRPVEA